MIYLFTGAIGAGKTLNAIKFILENSGKGGVFEDRQVVAYNVNGLNIPGWHDKTFEDLKDWYDYPPGTVFLVDEAQDMWPTAPAGSKMEDHLKRLAQSRHKGTDFILTCQYPRQLHTHVRALINEHTHLSRKYGTHKVVAHKWGRLEDNPNKSKTGAQQSIITLDKGIFDKYKSAEMHTAKRSVPWQFYALPALIVVLAFFSWKLYSGWIVRDSNTEQVQQSESQDSSTQSDSGKSTVQTVAPFDLVQQLTPTVANMDRSAPIYTDLHEAKSMPREYCIAAMSGNVTKCRCYTQQATRLNYELSACLNYIKNGYTFDYTREETRDVQRVQNGAEGDLLGAHSAPFDLHDKEQLDKEKRTQSMLSSAARYREF